MLSVLMLFVITATIGVKPATPRSDYLNAYADSLGSVTLTTAQADSLIRLLDELELENRLLKAQLVEVCPVPEPTSGWIVRTLKHPALWFCVGLTVGVVATR